MHRNLDDSTLTEYGIKLTTFARVALVCIALVVAMAYAAPAQSQTLTFTVETTTQGGAAVVPRLTWTTTAGASSCAASTVPADTNWAGTKAVSGTQVLPAISATRSYTLVCTWPGATTAVVSWTAPTTNTDGSALTDLAGFRVQYGRTATTLDTSVYLQNPATLTWTSPALAVGSWSFGVRAFNAAGLESNVSNVAAKVMTAATNQTRTLEVAIRFPNPPTGLTVE